MAMEISGKVVQLLPLQSGQGKNGTPWKKQEFILETGGQYPKKVCISAWGDKVDQFAIQAGEQITASIEVESREYNGKWYTDIKIWKVAKGGAQGAAPAQDGINQDFDPFYANQAQASASDDLPF